MPFRKGVKLSPEIIEKNRVAARKRFAEGLNLTAFKKGHVPTPEMRAKMGRKGEKSAMWKGGITSNKQEYRRILKSRNAEGIRAYFREWAKSHRDSKNVYTQNYRTLLKNNGGSFTPAQWEAKKLEHKNVCAICGSFGKLTIDHIIPVSKGGGSDISNIQPLCRRCNTSKQDMLMFDFLAYRERIFAGMIKEIKQMLQTEWAMAKQDWVDWGYLETDDTRKGKCEFIRYLQDQVDKITGELSG